MPEGESRKSLLASLPLSEFLADFHARCQMFEDSWDID
jgi:hypothetical protein